MEIIPRLTTDTLPDAASAARWRAEGIGLVHLTLDTLEGAEACLVALREAGFAGQVELTDSALAETAAERLQGLAERLFLPLDCLARPLVLMALLRRYGAFLGVSLSAEEGAVLLPQGLEPGDMRCFEIVRMLDAAGVPSLLYRDVAAECLPIGQIGRMAGEVDSHLYAAGMPDTLADLVNLSETKVRGWICPTAQVGAALYALQEGEETGCDTVG